MTEPLAHTMGRESRMNMLHLPEENVLLVVRGIIASLRREGERVTIATLEKEIASKGGVHSRDVDQPWEDTLKFKGARFHFQHPVVSSEAIEICFVADQF
jgi:hypothetical protein